MAGAGLPLVSLHSTDLGQTSLPSKPLFVPFCTLTIRADHQLLAAERSSGGPLPMTMYSLLGGSSDTAVFVDHAVKGMSMSLEPRSVMPLASGLVSALEQQLPLGETRRRYHARGKALYIAGVAPSGLIPGTLASLATRIPMLGAVDRTEPKGLSNVITYVGGNGFANILSWLTPGDGVILLTGELTDGEEPTRIIRALTDHGVDVLGVTSVFENERYSGRAALARFGVPARSLHVYAADEDLPHVNISRNVWAGLRYAIMRLERLVQHANPGARVRRIVVTPCSFTRGLAMRGSDIDNMYVFVDGMRQATLDRLGEAFLSWLAVEGLSFDDDNARPRLLSTSHLAGQRVGLGRNKVMTVYEHGLFVDPLDAAEESNRVVSMLYEKHVARLKLLSFFGELDDSLRQRLLQPPNAHADAHSRYFHQELISFFEVRPNRTLDASTLRLAAALDERYRASHWMYEIEAGHEEEFSGSLAALCHEGLVRIYDGALILLWRAHMLAWSNRFYERRIRLGFQSEAAGRDVLTAITRQLPKYDADVDPRDVLPGIESGNPHICEAALRCLPALPDIPLAAIHAAVRQLKSRSILVNAAAYETLSGDHSRYARPLMDFVRTELEADQVENTPVILAVRILCTYIRQAPESSDAPVRCLSTHILANDAMRDTIILDETIRHVAPVVRYVRDVALQKRVRQSVYRGAQSRIERQARLASEALGIIDSMPSA